MAEMDKVEYTAKILTLIISYKRPGKKCKTCFGTGKAHYYTRVGKDAPRYEGVCNCAWNRFRAANERYMLTHVLKHPVSNMAGQMWMNFDFTDLLRAIEAKNMILSAPDAVVSPAVPAEPKAPAAGVAL